MHFVPHMTDSPMDPKHILVATDFGDEAAKALDVGVELAKKYGATITLLHVYEIPPYPYPAMPVAVDFVTPIRDAAQKQLASAFEALKLRGVEARSELLYGPPGSAILETAEHRKADLIVVGTHGRKGVMRALLGSVAEKVVRLAQVPVLTVRGSTTAFSKILVPTDLSEHAERALSTATSLARVSGAKLHVVHVGPRVPYFGPPLAAGRAFASELMVESRKEFDSYMATVRARGIEATQTLSEGVAYVEINRAAKDVGADLIVMGTQGRTGIERVLLGSVAERVVRTSPIPVMVVPAPQTNAEQ
jgi:nucleotide-binding universal stress UspA family protein